MMFQAVTAVYQLSGAEARGFLCSFAGAGRTARIPAVVFLPVFLDDEAFRRTFPGIGKGLTQYIESAVGKPRQ